MRGHGGDFDRRRPDPAEQAGRSHGPPPSDPAATDATTGRGVRIDSEDYDPRMSQPATGVRAPRLSTTQRRVLVVGAIVAALGILVAVLVGPRSSAAHGDVTETFTVPSSRWIGLSGMAAQVQGTLGFVGDCPVLMWDDDVEGALVLPWAVGVRYDDGTRAVVHRVTGGVYAVEGGQIDAAGGWDEPGVDSSWAPACGGADVLANIHVNSWP